MRDRAAKIVLRASVFMSEWSDKGDLYFYVRLCKFNDACYFSDDELDPMNKDLAPLVVDRIEAVDSSAGSKLTSVEYEATF